MFNAYSGKEQINGIGRLAKLVKMDERPKIKTGTGKKGITSIEKDLINLLYK